MFRPRGRPNWRTHFGGLSVDKSEEKTKQGNRERKERKKGKSSDERAARKLEEGSLERDGKREREREREKRIRIKKRIAGGPARRGAAWHGAARRASSWGVKHLKIPVMQNIGKWPSRPGR